MALSWTSSNTTYNNWYSIAYNGTVYCGVRRNSYPKPEIYTSSDGSSWTLKATGGAGDYYVKVIAIGTNFVVCNFDYNLLTSEDNGDTWSAEFSSGVGVEHRLIKVNGKAYICGNSAAKYSATGLSGSWSSSINLPFYDIAHNGTIYCAIPRDFAGGKTYTSSDGISWDTNITTFPASKMIASGLGLFISGNNSVQSYVPSSSDGINWTNNSVSSSYGAYNFLEWGGLYFVLGASRSGGTDLKPLISTDGTTWAYHTTALPCIDLERVSDSLIVGLSADTGTNFYAITQAVDNIMTDATPVDAVASVSSNVLYNTVRISPVDTTLSVASYNRFFDVKVSPIDTAANSHSSVTVVRVALGTEYVEDESGFTLQETTKHFTMTEV